MMIIIHGNPREGMSYRSLSIAKYFDKNEKKTPTTKTSDVSIAP